MPEQVDLNLTVASGLDVGSVADVFDELKGCPITTAVTKRPHEGPYAFLEWLIPTGLVLFFGKPYAEEFSKTLGHEHAKAVHKAMVKLWKRVFGPKPTVAYEIRGSSGKPKSSVFSATVSTSAMRRDGGQVVLLFLKHTSQEDFTLAVNQFGMLLEEHYNQALDRLSTAIEKIEYLRPNWKALVYMNPDTKELELIDYVESSKSHRLIAIPIPPHAAAHFTVG